MNPYYYFRLILQTTTDSLLLLLHVSIVALPQQGAMYFILAQCPLVAGRGQVARSFACPSAARGSLRTICLVRGGRGQNRVILVVFNLRLPLRF